MTTKTWTAGTVIDSSWLQDVDSATYKAASGLTGASNRSAVNKFSDVISVKDYGAVGDGVTDDTTAITNAMTAANNAARTLFFPKGNYIYNPSAKLNVSYGLKGENKYDTKITVSTSYAGEVFRLTTQAEIQSITIVKAGLSKTAGSIGLRIAGANIQDITVSNVARQIYIRGFDINLDIQNAYILTLDQVHCETGNEGLYCVPDATTYGYITTHVHLHCTYANNVRNVYYNTTNYSQALTFVGCAIEGASGATQQCYINKIRIVKFINTYFEGASGIKGLYLNDVAYVSVDGGFFNGTGGILLANLGQAEFKNIWCTAATDVITGADGSQTIKIFGSLFPSSGNSAITAWGKANVEQTTYNGVFYGDYSTNWSDAFYDNFQSGGGTLTINMNNGNLQRITVTDTTAFTLAAPTNAVRGNELDLLVQNSSGSAMGAITWNAVFKKTAFTNPATGNNRSIRFRYDGSNWFEVSRGAADVPN